MSLNNRGPQGSADLWFLGPSQTSVKVARPQTLASGLHDVPVYLRAFSGTKLDCLAIEVNVCKKRALEGFYAVVLWLRVKLAPMQTQVQSPTQPPHNYKNMAS